MVFTLTMSDTEATHIIAPLISYLGFINKPKDSKNRRMWSMQIEIYC